MPCVNITYKVVQSEMGSMATDEVNEHRCSCGETFETAEELREHAREEHGAIV